MSEAGKRMVALGAVALAEGGLGALVHQVASIEPQTLNDRIFEGINIGLMILVAAGLVYSSRPKDPNGPLDPKDFLPPLRRPTTHR